MKFHMFFCTENHDIPLHMRRSLGVGLVLVNRLQCWPDIGPTLGGRLMFVRSASTANVHQVEVYYTHDTSCIMSTVYIASKQMNSHMYLY